MNHKSLSYLSIFSIIAIIMGAVIGYYIKPEIIDNFSFIGLLYTNALKFLFIPLVISIIICGITAMKDINKNLRAIGKTLSYFIATGFMASLVGILTVFVFKSIIGRDFGASLLGSGDTLAANGIKNLSFSSIMNSIIPDNFFQLPNESHTLGIIVLVFVFAFAINAIGRKSKTVVDLMTVFKDISLKSINYFLYLTPLAVLFLVASTVSENIHSSVSQISVLDILGSLMWFSTAFLIGTIIFAFVILPVIFKMYTGQMPWQFYKNLIPAFTTSLATSSSLATMPVTFENITEKSHIDNRASAFVLPLGTVINLTGTSLFLSSAAVFIGYLFNLDLGLGTVFLIIIGSLIYSFGSSLLPNTLLISLAGVMTFASFDPQAFAGLGILVAVDWLYDRVKTFLNITGDAVGAAVIAESFEFKTARTTRLKSEKKPKFTKRDQIPRTRNTYSKNETKTTSKPQKLDRIKTKIPNLNKKSETASPFDMPKVPYHTLDKEIHAREKSETTDKKETPKKKTFQENKKQQPAPKSVPKDTKPIKTFNKIPVPPYVGQREKSSPPLEEKSVDNINEISKETIERERARIAAQLKEMKEKEKNKNYLIDNNDSNGSDSEKKLDSETEKKDSAPEIIMEKSSEEPKTDSSIPNIDFLAEDASKTDVTDLTRQDDEISINNDEPSELEDSSIRYGRSKPKRGIKPKTTTDEKNSENENDDDPDKIKDSFALEEMSFGRSKRKK